MTFPKIKSSLCLTFVVMLFSVFALSTTAEAATTLYQWRGEGVTAYQTKYFGEEGDIKVRGNGGTVSIKIDQYSQNSNTTANAKYTLLSVSNKVVGSSRVVVGDRGGSAKLPAATLTFTDVLPGDYMIQVINNTNAGIVIQGDVYFTAN
ncbi:hypothetical protein [Paenibacillus polymyxa]|uniref:hypothetical protein n=1 Tax=Paenibacillus polymyxa TaxID=1406 RepID=UPI00287FD73F|nr:hypothetical protein [Paenibacillus polymyxa]